jgi:hypothetical protein
VSAPRRHSAPAIVRPAARASTSTSARGIARRGAEEVQRQRRPVALAGLRLAVVAVHVGEVLGAGLVAVHDAEFHARAPHLRALGAQVLALAAAEGAEEVRRNRASRVVAPLELHVAARQPARRRPRSSLPAGN